MKLICVCPMNDTLEIGSFELYSDNRIYGACHSAFMTYKPPRNQLYPFVPAYFQSYNQQRLPLRKFLRDNTSMLRPRDFLVALHDDATDLEAHALSELLIAVGAKSTLMEYRAFLLSSEEAFIAVTASKRAVTVTLVRADKEDTERIFIPINEATPDRVTDHCRSLIRTANCRFTASVCRNRCMRSVNRLMQMRLSGILSRYCKTGVCKQNEQAKPDTAFADSRRRKRRNPDRFRCTGSAADFGGAAGYGCYGTDARAGYAEGVCRCGFCALLFSDARGGEKSLPPISSAPASITPAARFSVI